MSVSSNRNKLQNNSEHNHEKDIQKQAQNNSNNFENQITIQSSQKSSIFVEANLLKDSQYYHQNNQNQSLFQKGKQNQNQYFKQTFLNTQNQTIIEQTFETNNNFNLCGHEQPFKNQYDLKNDKFRNKLYQKQFNHSNNNLDLYKIIIGLPNVGLTCAVNSAIQTLKQIYYFDQKIFDNSGFAEDFVQLFQVMEEKNIQKIYHLVEMLVVKSKLIQKHTFSGDAYMCLIYFFYEMKKSLSDEQQEQFDNNFSRKYQDKLKCSQCKKTKIEKNDEFISCLDYSEFGYECSKLDEAFSDYGDKGLFKQINSDDIICPECQSQLVVIRKYKNAPKFMLIRLTPFLSKQFSSSFLNKEFQYLVNQKNIYKYSIVGFCNYNRYHYTYTAKYYDKWIEFNDLNVLEVIPDCSKAIYFLFKRI
ncbi:hypothetical protein ABPG72_017687 [Tetrahymena utriculariae]